MIEDIKYIRKEHEEILIPSKNELCNRYNPVNWQIVTGKPEYRIQFSLARYHHHNLFLRNGIVIDKNFFTFVFTGEKFPILLRYKEKLLILHKYKFSKLYILNNDILYCYYFKRGVLFYVNCVDNNNATSIKRLIKLLKLKNYG